MNSLNITARKELALHELKLLNKVEVSDAEFFKVWNKHLYGDLNMLKFEDFLNENGITVKQ